MKIEGNAMADKVLIVDDDVQTLRLVGLMLERQGYKILAADNGAQALRMAQAEHPDVIILDVMMPDMDGYEVTRRLRADQGTAKIPVLMFTAKTQVEDKVNGYEAGADDYLTKPIHPAELNARLRALISRSKARSEPARERGYMVGLVGAKGGVGVSTLALNLAVTYHQRTKADVIAAEMRPGHGTWSLELGLTMSSGLDNLLRMRTTDINTVTIENELARMPYGVRLLLASTRAKDARLAAATDQIEAVVDQLPYLAKMVFLDLGANCLPNFDAVINPCNEVIVVTEPYPACVQRARSLVEDLGNKGFGRSKLLTVVSINRTRADVQLSMIQMQEILGIPIAQVFPPAPEIAFQAAARNLPMVQVQIGGVISLQFLNMAERLAQRVPA